jgi:hypothetical protein
VIGALLAWVAAALAAQVAVDVDTREVREGQTVGLTLTVVDATTRAPPELALPDGLQVSFQGQSQSRTIINFQSTTTTTFRYSLTALRRGAYTLGPFTVPTSEGPLRTDVVTIEVGARTSGGSEALVAEVGTERAYVGQVLVYHLRFQTDKALVHGRWSPPQAEGFTVEPSVEPVTAEYQIEQDGRPVSVEELFYPLRASAAGDRAIPGGVLQAGFAVARARPRGQPGFFSDLDRFGDVRTEVFSAPPARVEVVALPEEGRPAAFSGLVGRFEVTATPSATEVNVGDTVTLEVVVRGDGPLAGFALPALPAGGYRVYDDQPAAEARLVDGTYLSTATFKRAIVPQEPGRLTLPGIEVSYFDPRAARYATASTQPVELVVGGTASAAQVASYSGGRTATVAELGQDILPVRTAVGVSRAWDATWAVVLVLPGLVLLGAEAVRGGALRVRRRGPAVEALPMLDALPAGLDARLGALEHALRAHVAARLGVSPAEVRRDDLRRLGAPAEAVEAAWRALESARYGGGSGSPDDVVRRALEALQ